MIKPEDYKPLYGKESHGSYGTYGLKIDIFTYPHAVDREAMCQTKNVYEAIDKLEYEIMKAMVAAKPETAEETANNRKFLLGCFPQPPAFVEEIPNGYCNRGCCAHLPWFIVTTSVGRIRIGWRKRVILIDWSDTVPKDRVAVSPTKKAEELFPKEDVTKDTHMIHAWSYDKATAYLKAIITGVPLTNV